MTRLFVLLLSNLLSWLLGFHLFAFAAKESLTVDIAGVAAALCLFVDVFHVCPVNNTIIGRVSN